MTLAAPTIPGPDPHTRRPALEFPRGACDCHAHVFGPQARFPYAAKRGYTPPDAPTADYVRMLRTIGCERAVLVQPSVYGTDNRCLVQALDSGAFEFRGVAVIDDATGDDELEAMHRAGVRGVRLNLATRGSTVDLGAAPRIAARIAALGWHLQFYLDVRRLPDVDRELTRLPVDIVIDHFGHVAAADGVEAPGFQTLLRLAHHERCWFKLIGPYRISSRPPRFADTVPLARALVAAAPDRCVWGTDWPHPNTAYMPNDGDLADLVTDWLPDEAVRTRVLRDNPARLYGFSR